MSNSDFNISVSELSILCGLHNHSDCIFNTTLTNSTGLEMRESDDNDDEFWNKFKLLENIAYTLVFVVGMIGNAIVIYVVLRFCKKKTATNIYILNLAIADAMLLLVIPFYIIDQTNRIWPLGRLLSKFYWTIRRSEEH